VAALLSEGELSRLRSGGTPASLVKEYKLHTLTQSDCEGLHLENETYIIQESNPLIPLEGSGKI